MTIVESILAVFMTVLEWFVEAVSAVSPLFFTPEAGLTLIGSITVIGVGFAVTLLVIAMLRGLLRFGK